MKEVLERFENKVPPDVRDLIFRGLFSSIFLGLGAEHLFDDRLIQHLMPPWLASHGFAPFASVLSGTILLVGGLAILLGYHVAAGARLLGAFLVVVTLTVHLPGCFATPPTIDHEWAWLWTVFQRSNLVKNLCLFGVCVHLTTLESGRFSLENYLKRRRAKTKASANDASV